MNFKQISFGNPISSLPVDPINTTSSGSYYTYVSGGSWILTAIPESARQKTNYQTKSAIPNYPGVIAVGTNLTLSPLYSVTGLVGYWTFDEGIGTAVSDSSGNGNTGTWQGTLGSQWTTGKVGTYAGNFNGTNNYVDTGTSSMPSGNQARSFFAWIYLPVAPANPYDGIWSVGPGGSTQTYFLISYGGTERLTLWTNGAGDFASSLAPSVGAWHFVGYTYDPSGGTVTVYVDAQSQVGAGRTLNTSLTASAIGRDTSQSSYLKTILDDVRVYNRALSAAEVSALYNATK